MFKFKNRPMNKYFTILEVVQRCGHFLLYDFNFNLTLNRVFIYLDVIIHVQDILSREATLKYAVVKGYVPAKTNLL